MDEVIQTTIDRSRHTVLVVDDQAATRYSTGRVLRAAGFRTVEAASGTDALAMAQQGVSAVVLDVHLPDMDGFEVCRILRERPATQALPVVHLSAAYVRNEDRITGLNAGADAYLVHPVEPAVLVATLQALIRARTAEDDLRRSELRFRAIYDQAQSGIVLIDAEGRFADANPAMLRLLGRGSDEVVGRAVADLAPLAWRERARRHFGPGADGSGPWRGELPLVGLGGREVPLEWAVSSHVEPGLRIGIATDVSERHELEQRRREVLEREQAARSSAERHSRTKDDFIAILSHELRTPLNAIMGWVHILLRRDPAPEARKGLEAIERNVKTQARIISDILDVSRINAGKLRLHRESTDPAELVLSSLGSLRTDIDARQLRVETDMADAHAAAWLDPARFQQIVWNLMTNAVKFSPVGGEIRVLLRRAGDRLQLTVQDFGQGIKPDFIAHLFDRFSQSDSPGNRRHGGLGLGLSIVHHLVELHGGRVWAHSAGEGQGTTMQVEIDVAAPVQAQPETDSQPGDAEETPEHTERLRGRTVLVVEDDPDAAEMLGVVLGDRGMRVRLAHDYDGALAALADAWPDVLVCDIGLPGRDGHELIRQVRARQPAGRPRLPAIALTAFARGEDRLKAIDAGFDLHLGKPLKPHLLLGALATLAADRRQA